MNNNLKAFFTKAASFIGMLSIIPIQIFFANVSSKDVTQAMIDLAREKSISYIQ